MAKAALLPQFVLQFFDNNGVELSGGTLQFYEAGTTTAKDTYTDSGLGTANPNPITLDSAGRPDNAGSPIQIWLDGSYKLVVKDSSANTIRTEDNLVALAEATGYAAKTANYTVTAADFAKLINVDATAGEITITLPAAATAGAGFIASVGKSDSGANAVIIDGNGSETINGSTTLRLENQYDIVSLMCDGSNWVEQARRFAKITEDATGLDIVGPIDVTSGNFTVTSGNINMTLGDLDMTAGDINMTLGNVVMTDGDLTMSKGTVTIADEDARTATVDDLLTLTSTTSGTPAAGIGTGILIKGESADEAPSDFGKVAFVASDVTAGSEDTGLSVETRVAGAALVETYNLSATGAFPGNITHANTAARTYTLPDNNETFTPYGARAVGTVDTSVANNSATKMTLNSEKWDSQGNFDPTTNYRFTVPTGGDGKYIITGSIYDTVAVGVNGYVQCLVYKNGASAVTSSSGYHGSTTAVIPGCSVTSILDLAAADYIELYSYQVNGGSSTLTLRADFSISRLHT